MIVIEMENGKKIEVELAPDAASCIFSSCAL